MYIMISKKAKLGTEPYKGVRDFYPEDMFIQNHIQAIWRKTAESYGYEEFGASILEPSELYRSKTSEEIVNEQTYSFLDRGDREVTLRPEMTPTIARMVAAKKQELIFPLRWFSIPNLFRYEKPQRGRLREHWQFNADIFGADGKESDLEIISLARQTLLNFGAKENDFEIKINNRKIMSYILRSIFELDEDNARRVSRLIDKKEKMSDKEFSDEAQNIFGARTSQFIHVLESKDLDTVTMNIRKGDEEIVGIVEIRELLEALKEMGVTNAFFSPTLMRGFDYYTGMVFEIYDKDSANKRALFGGGRYDDLLTVFGEERIRAAGFGMGDVTARDFIETHGLLPEYAPACDSYIASIGQEQKGPIRSLSEDLRQKGLRVVSDVSDKRIQDKLKKADRKKYPFVLIVGADEVKTGKYKIKNMKTGEEIECRNEEIADKLLVDSQ